MRGKFVWFGLLCLSPSLQTMAWASNDLSPKEHYAEIEYAHSQLSSGYAPWNDVNTLNYFGVGEHRFILELDDKNHFGESAAVVGLTYTHIYNPLWYQEFTVSFSTNSSIVPGLVLFSEIHRKLLPDQSLVAGFGVGHELSQEPYSDNYGLAELTYYLNANVSLQGGARLNRSDPGSVITGRGYGSLNYIDRQWEAYLRYEAGQEGYTVVGQNNFKNEFGSREESIQLRCWLNTNLGVSARLDFYQSDYYNRNEIGVDFLVRY